jgi:hypothetical protein
MLVRKQPQEVLPERGLEGHLDGVDGLLEVRGDVVLDDDFEVVGAE